MRLALQAVIYFHYGIRPAVQQARNDKITANTQLLVRKEIEWILNSDLTLREHKSDEKAREKNIVAAKSKRGYHPK